MASTPRQDTGRVGGRIGRYARVTSTMTGLAARMAVNGISACRSTGRNMLLTFARRLVV